PVVRTQTGEIHGLYLETFNQDAFLGVPFAEAPRLDRPRPIAKCQTGAINATQYGTTCYGSGSNLDLNLTQGEDCLNLNVVRPSTVHTGLPVLVWIYGGGFTQGSNADPMWNLTYIVQTSVENEQPIVAVSINYRLSFLGFPVGNVSLNAGISNLGLWDQRLALEWIQENIESFGGDPDKVTVWGESAGGCSTGFHLISQGGNGSRGLFRAAIMSSGTILGSCNPKFSSSLNAEYDQITTHANCSDAVDTLQCLREAPIEAIYPFELSVPNLGPVIDGDLIKREPVLELDEGHVHRVPIIVGANTDEGLFAVNSIGGAPEDAAGLRRLLAAVLPGLQNTTVDSLLAAYPEGDQAPPYSLPPDYPFCDAMEAANLSCTPQHRRTAAILGDYFADAGRRYVAEKWSQLGLSTYSYRFAAESTSIPISYWTGLGPGFATHGADLAYDFRLPGNFTTSIHYYPPVKPVPSHEELSRLMVTKYISFVNSLDPNNLMLSQAPAWPSYGDSPVNYVFNASNQSTTIRCELDDYRAEAIGIW
ncbi:hypothetical protein M409DRAFT_31747, partial [Zasmidium cellare ATCC 36951]